MQVRPRVIDLFSGCGGFVVGAEAAGLCPTLAFDIDRILTSSHAKNHPRTKLVLADLSTVTGTAIEAEAGGKIEGVFGGPPCQGFSAIGRRKSDDPRRTLLGHFFRLVAELKPAFFVMENVRGLAYPEARPALDDAIALLPSRYKTIGPLILDAADFGAATRRARLFIIGYDPNRFEHLSEEELVAKKTRPATVRAAISDLSSIVKLACNDEDLWKIVKPGRASQYAINLRAEDLLFTGNQRTKHTIDVVRRFENVIPGGVDPVGRHPRLHWDGQCPTLRAGTGNDHGSFQSVRPIHPTENRVITVREAARLQGFPDRFRFHSTIWHSFRMIGNSVSPIIADAIFKIIAKHMEYRQPFDIAAE